MAGNQLISSGRVKGTGVYGPDDSKVGQIEALMIEKVAGRVRYAVMSFGGFLGWGIAITRSHGQRSNTIPRLEDIEPVSQRTSSRPHQRTPVGIGNGRPAFTVTTALRPIGPWEHHLSSSPV